MLFEVCNLCAPQELSRHQVVNIKCLIRLGEHRSVCESITVVKTEFVKPLKLPDNLLRPSVHLLYVKMYIDFDALQ